jgi:hypothetical protein
MTFLCIIAGYGVGSPLGQIHCNCFTIYEAGSKVSVFEISRA